MLHPKTDIRSMFNKTVVAVPPPVVSVAIAVAPPPTEKNKKAIKRDEIDVLCDAYYKAYTGEKCKGIVNYDVESVKATLKEIIEKCKVKPKKLYQYFHHLDHQ